MALGNTTKTDILGLLFNSTALSGLWTTALAVALHTADPGAAGTQSTSEISYTGYARVSTVRNATTNWTVSGSQVSNATAVTFGTMTAGAGGTATFLSIGLAGGQILASGAMSPSIVVANSSIPNFPIASIVLTLT